MSIFKRSMLLAACLLLVAQWGVAQPAPAFSPDDIDIPYEKFVLENGLRLIVHEDHKAPIVAVNVWYHVGSKNEKVGKTGFAHLFEHLMFNGSENFNDDYFQALDRIGATDRNGTTNPDRTNYFQNVPLAAFDQVLFLESDRMGHLLGAIDQAKLDEQRGVVQNEKRQGENQPYGRSRQLLTEAMFPKGHPYSWTTIGSMEDLNAASLEDVQEWFKTYYGAANAVLVVAGDVDAQEVYKKVKMYFGDIPSGPSLARMDADVPVRLNDTRQSMQDRVPEARVYQLWNTPPAGSQEDVYLDLVSAVLSSGKNSRLYKRLVYEEQIASGAYAYEASSEIASNFYIIANVKPGQEVEKVEAALNEELAKLIAEGPTDEELKRVKAEYFADFIKGLERIGGFGGKSDILASNETYFDDPEYYKTVLNMVQNATAEDVRRAAEKWLSRGKHTLVVTPFPEYSTTESTVDRSQGLPALGEPVAAKFPDLERATLKNGMEVVLARREGVPTIEMEVIFDAGFASDALTKPGMASLAMSLMDEGTKKRSALEINEQLQLLGAELYAYSDRDASYVSMSTLKPTFGPSLELMTDVIMNPSFPEQDFNRLKEEQLAGIQREKSNPVRMASRVFPRYLYGEGHPYSTPGSGYESSVQAISRDEVVQFHQNWIRPNNATLMVVGDITMEELKRQLDQQFAGWEKGKVPKKNVADVNTDSKKRTLYLMDRPESIQSVIFGGYLIEPYGDLSEIALDAMTTVLGGSFTSRVNMNLREDKHWSYGARAGVSPSKGQRVLFTYAPVQSDKTKESVQELIKEFEIFVGDKPVTEDEFKKVTENEILQLPGRWETNSAVANSISNMVKYELPEDYYQTYDQKFRNLKLEDVHSLAKKVVRPGDLTFFVVGDKETVLPTLKDLGFDEIIEVDADGNPVTDKKKAQP